MIENEFSGECKYKLFRSVEEILHPSISKKNISNYRIEISEKYLPLRVFYPKKVTGINKVIIYVHGSSYINGKSNYTNICYNMAVEIDHLLIAIDYDLIEGKYKDTVSNIYNTINYLYSELINLGISSSNIILMGDSIGCSFINSMKLDLECKKIYFYPVVSLGNVKGSISNKVKEYFDYVNYTNDKLYEDKSKKLIIVGKMDPYLDIILNDFKDDSVSQIPFCSHGFLSSMDSEVQLDVYSEIKKFLK